jgi:hypothetical protein
MPDFATMTMKFFTQTPRHAGESNTTLNAAATHTNIKLVNHGGQLA